ncbi:MAG TPA: signal peptidase II [Gemmatimonadaceae bacterium]|nr:signal peptidase II [Gemmatimonadaceae bacterium]
MSTVLPGGAELSGPLAGELDSDRTRVRVAFWTSMTVVLFADLITKSIAAATLMLWHPPRQVFGDALRFAIAYNPGVAFGWHVGDMSRPVFSVLAVIVLLILFRLYAITPAWDGGRALALGLICGGAIGNLVDRLRSPRGVVDFIDIGIGDMRWWTFNLADVGVGIGAVMLIRILWREEDSDPGPAPSA